MRWVPLQSQVKNEDVSLHFFNFKFFSEKFSLKDLRADRWHLHWRFYRSWINSPLHLARLQLHARWDSLHLLLQNFGLQRKCNSLARRDRKSFEWSKPRWCQSHWDLRQSTLSTTTRNRCFLPRSSSSSLRWRKVVIYISQRSGAIP